MNRFVLVASLSIAALGCGGMGPVTGNDAAAPGSDAEPGADAVANVDGASADASFADVVDPTPPGVTRVSYIHASSLTTPGGTAGSSLGAGFYDLSPQPFDVAEERVGPCVASTTTRRAMGDGGTSYTNANAGTLRLTGGARAVELAFGPAGYSPVSEMIALWSGGERLTFTASGATVRAFEATVTAPNHVQMTSPAFYLGAPDVPADRGSDLALAWSGTSAGSVEVSLSRNTMPGEPSLRVVCTFPAADGRGTIPAAALGRFTPGATTIAAHVVSAARVFVAERGFVDVRAESVVFGSRGPFPFGLALR